MTTTQAPQFVDQQAWTEARKKLLAEEKDLTRRLDALAAKRRALPWTEVTNDYRFTGPDGPVRLSELFVGLRHLVVYHFMFAPEWEEGCPICSFWADNFDGIPFHLAQRNTAFICVSNAQIDQIESYRARMGWRFRWVSAADTSFNCDMGVSPPDGLEDGDSWDYNYGSWSVREHEMPGLSVFARGDDGRIGLTYQTFSRGLEALNSAYQVLDLTAAGRAENGLPFPMAWVQRHDQLS